MVSNGADIQIENGGWVRIHYAILEQLALGDFTSREYACVLYLLRMTYGFNRKECELSNGDFAKSTNMDRSAVIKTLKSLVDRGVIIKREGDAYHASTWEFNKYFEQWKMQTSVKTTSSQINTSLDETSGCFDTTTSGQNDTSSSVKTTTSYLMPKDNIKDNIHTESAGADISIAERFRLLNEELKTTKNRPAKLHDIYALCFGAECVPDYGYLGKVARQVGGAGRLAQLMFELVTRPPAGDILAYIVAEENGRRKRAAQMGGNREISEVVFSTNGADIYG